MAFIVSTDIAKAIKHSVVYNVVFSKIMLNAAFQSTHTHTHASSPQTHMHCLLQHYSGYLKVRRPSKTPKHRGRGGVHQYTVESFPPERKMRLCCCRKTDATEVYNKRIKPVFKTQMFSLICRSLIFIQTHKKSHMI